MMKPIKLKVCGIKCDAPGCDYIDPGAVADERWIDVPCPKCGAILFTESDWKLVKMLSTVSDWANDALGPVPDDAKFERLRIEMDGSGIPVKVYPDDKPEGIA